MRYICIHGHFYQPPRENPWLEVVELQDSAYPYHDWNARVTAECYGPNAWSRILNSEGRIVKIVDNYARISFNFGPTLLAWLAEQEPAVYQAILAADRESQVRFDGHGSAMAQAYNHIIMPLANSRDKRTQVIWGIRDFEARFGRTPAGMWLPETAVDLETLDILAEHGIAFTILAPHQAKRVRPREGGEWQDVSDGEVETTRPYLVSLPSGRSIAVFFYHGPISREIAFGDLLNSGERFAQRLLAAAWDAKGEPLVHVATDGETYGHHHRFGDMALAFALERIESSSDVALTNYAAYLAQHPPTWEVEIQEFTSWSCIHGVERWRSNCGCNTGAHPGWTQAWRAPLREALDWLRDTLAPLYERMGSELFTDPWAARDDYISVILDRAEDNITRFLERWQRRTLEPDERVTALKLLELQRMSLLMYTSCGWFFDEISGIETVQVLQYAGRVIQLAEELFGDRFEEQFLAILEKAPSNIPEIGNGRVAYERFVLPARVDLPKVAAHYAVSALFEGYSESTTIACYQIDRMAHDLQQAGRARLMMCQIRVKSFVTEESDTFNVAALHLGDHNVIAGVRGDHDEQAYRKLVAALTASFARADIPETIRALDAYFRPATYSLRTLFRDEQRKILDLILASTLQEAEELYRHLYEDSQPLMRFLTDLGVPIPPAFQTAARFTVNADLRREIESPQPDFERIDQLFREAETWHLDLDQHGLAYALQRALERAAERWRVTPEDPDLLRLLTGLSSVAPGLKESVNTWHVQNIVYEVLHTVYPQMSWRYERGDDAALEWIHVFRQLCDALWIAAE